MPRYAQAEGYQADQFPCTFSRELEFEGAAALNRTKGQLHQVGHTKRRFTGYMLVCSDPGPEFKFFTFTTNEMVLKVPASPGRRSTGSQPSTEHASSLSQITSIPSCGQMHAVRQAWPQPPKTKHATRPAPGPLQPADWPLEASRRCHCLQAAAVLLTTAAAQSAL